MTNHPPRRPPDPAPALPPPTNPEFSDSPDPTDLADPVPAPRAIGDVVPGEPPVPLTLWYLPAGVPGDAVSGALARRLRSNYAHPRDPVLDLTSVPTPARPAEGSLALLITTWPQTEPTVDEHLGACAAFLRPGGCAAVVVTANDIPEQLGLIVGAARQAGLTYLQHLVVAHRLTTREPTAVSRQRSRGKPQPTRRHLRTHTDVLVFACPRAADV